LSISFLKRQEARKELERKLVEGKNLGAKLKPRIELRRLEVRGLDFNHNLFFYPFS